MKNLELAQIFYLISELLDMKEDSFRARAYEKVARVLESLEKDIADIYKEGGFESLKKIPGVGQGIAQRIEEFIKTGRIKAYDRLKKQCPVDLETLTSIEGLGSRKIKALYKKLKIRNLRDLERAAKAGKIKKLAGFGEKSEKNILQGIEFVRAGKGRFLLGAILPVVRQIISQLKQLPELDKIEVAGSIRRMQETIGDIDILATLQSRAGEKTEKIMDFFVKLPGVVKVWANGPIRSSVRFKGGFDCDLRVIKKQSYGAALQYFTGSKDHNIATRRLAQQKGLKLNEYGVFRRAKRLAGQTEKEVYQAIGLPYIEPELRTNSGEIEAGLTEKLPHLIDYHNIRGETQCHTDWSDGVNTIEQMAKAARKMGYQYIVITDHAGFLRIANGLDEKRLLKQMAEIDRLNQRLSGIKILKGAEVDIKNDGSLAIKDEVLAKLDVVVASIHSGFKMPKEKMTQRLIRAIENPQVDIIGHPTGRVIFQRSGYTLDLEKVFKTAKKHQTVLEINAFFNRLDLKDTDVRQAIEKGIKLTIGTDSHAANHLSMMELGIAQARRGWAEKKDILNTRSLTDFLKFFKK